MRTSLFAIIVLVLASRAAFSAPEQGDLRESAGKLRVWHTAQQSWVSPETFFQLELRRLNGPTYGSITEYPPYSSVKEWESLVEVLADGSECPMVFFHSRWRRLPDVLALDDRLRNYGGCARVF